MKTLLVIDMQNGFIGGKNNKNLIDKINNLIANDKYENIIFTKYLNDRKKNSLYQDKIRWTGLTTKEEQEIVVNIPKNSIVFKKYGYGLMQKDIKFLKSLNLDEIDICGVKAEACVYAISLQLWDVGIYPNILINYVSGDVEMKNIYIKQFGGVDYKK